MISINPVGATIDDLSIIEAGYLSGAARSVEVLTPAVSTTNRKIECVREGNRKRMSVESAFRVSVLDDTGGKAFMGNLVVDCTVSAPCDVDDGSLESLLARYAVEANLGFARTLLYQHSLASTLPGGLILPPMAFDGSFD